MNDDPLADGLTHMFVVVHTPQAVTTYVDGVERAA